MELNLYDFYTKGYSVTELTDELTSYLWRIIYTTNWKDDRDGEQVPDWVDLTDFATIDSMPLEQISVRRYLFKTPTELKTFGQKILDSDYFDPLLAELVGNRYFEHRWMIKLEILSYLLRKNTAPLNWHTDYNGAEDFFLLVYLTEPGEQQGGEIEFGIQDKDGTINTVGIEQPTSGKLICVNCTNPYFKHRVTENSGYTRYALNIKFRINKP
jgi:hypothetical protein